MDDLIDGKVVAPRALGLSADGLAERSGCEPPPAGPVAVCGMPAGPTKSAAEDFELCNECGGLCCALYLAHDENGEYIGDGWLPEYVALWLERLRETRALVVTETEYRAGDAGVEPLHDPRLSHLPTREGEAYRATLPGWVDVRKCQFCHPETGCMLPREYRADICREYVCELWRLG